MNGVDENGKASSVSSLLEDQLHDKDESENRQQEKELTRKSEEKVEKKTLKDSKKHKKGEKLKDLQENELKSNNMNGDVDEVDGLEKNKKQRKRKKSEDEDERGMKIFTFLTTPTYIYPLPPSQGQTMGQIGTTAFTCWGAVGLEKCLAMPVKGGSLYLPGLQAAVDFWGEIYKVLFSVICYYKW